MSPESTIARRTKLSPPLTASTANSHVRRRTEKWRRKSAANGSLSPSQDSTAQKSTRGIAYKLRLRGRRTFSLSVIRKLDRSCKKARPCDGQSTRHLGAVYAALLSLSNSQWPALHRHRHRASGIWHQLFRPMRVHAM